MTLDQIEAELKKQLGTKEEYTIAPNILDACFYVVGMAIEQEHERLANDDKNRQPTNQELEEVADEMGAYHFATKTMAKVAWETFARQGLVPLSPPEKSNPKMSGIESLQAGLYKHHKGGLCQALGVAQHSERDEQLVVYVSLSHRPGLRLWARPFAMWLEYVKWPDGRERPRFSYQGLEIEDSKDSV